MRNQNRTAAQQLAGQHAIVEMYKAAGIAVERGSIMAAFGCNFEGDIPVSRVVALVGQILDVAQQHGVTLEIHHARRHHGLGDAARRQAHGRRVARTLARSRWRCICTTPAAWPSPTRIAGLEMGVTRFDCGRGRPRRLSVRRARRRRRQCLHRGSGVHVPGTRHQNRHRSRRADRMRASSPRTSSATRCPAR